MGQADTAYYKQSTLQQLRGFYHAARTGGFSKAARRLALSQPAVSLQIQALERELGVTLFERRGPKIALTPEGRTLFDLAAPLVEGLDALPANFASRRGAVEMGRLDIAAGESTILYILPPYIKRFCHAFPGVELHLHNVAGSEGLARLRALEVDLAVGSMRDEQSDILYMPIFHYDPVLITPRGHPLARKRGVTLRDISGYPLIMPPRHSTTRPIIAMAFAEQELSYDVRMEAGGWEIIKKYVELGLGVSIVTSVCLSGRERLEVISMSRYLPKRDYGIVLRRGRRLSAAARAFVHLLQPAFDPDSAVAPAITSARTSRRKGR
ncbi:MAG: LysR family transcriptional regulator [Planctomycetota bacterium]